MYIIFYCIVFCLKILTPCSLLMAIILVGSLLRATTILILSCIRLSYSSLLCWSSVFLLDVDGQNSSSCARSSPTFSSHLRESRGRARACKVVEGVPNWYYGTFSRDSSRKSENILYVWSWMIMDVVLLVLINPGP